MAALPRHIMSFPPAWRVPAPLVTQRRMHLTPASLRLRSAAHPSAPAMLLRCVPLRLRCALQSCCRHWLLWWASAGLRPKPVGPSSPKPDILAEHGSNLLYKLSRRSRGSVCMPNKQRRALGAAAQRLAAGPACSRAYARASVMQDKRYRPHQSRARAWEASAPPAAHASLAAPQNRRLRAAAGLARMQPMARVHGAGDRPRAPMPRARPARQRRTHEIGSLVPWRSHESSRIGMKGEQ
jgi:hypothetical protein